MCLLGVQDGLISFVFPVQSKLVSVSVSYKRSIQRCIHRVNRQKCSFRVLRRAGHTIDTNQMQFLHIGKHSAAHLLAIATLRGKEKPNRTITLEEMLKEFKQ